jgi:predicted membrane GTPase involved in stress response
LSVQRAAVTAITGRKGVVYVMRDGKSETREVAHRGFLAGLDRNHRRNSDKGEKVVISGHEDLTPSDKLTETSGARQ